VGQVDDLSAPLPGLFKGAEDGTKAYFDMVNSEGGVDGRKLVLDARDSAYQTGQVVAETTAQTKSDFALVGGFSLLDSAEQAPIDAARMPDVAYPLSPSLASDRNVYSPLPNSDPDYPVGIFKYLKKEFPEETQHVGILYASATSSTQAAESSFERAMKSQGFKIVYDDSYGPLQTTFLPNVLAMKSDGVKMFFSLQLPDTNAATLAKEMQQQDFDPINIEGAAYSDQLVSLAGSAAEGMYIEQPYVLYLGEDASVVPAVGTFDHWVKVANPSATFEIETVYGWASAQLFVQALKDAGSTPTRAGLFAALDKITSFDASGLVAPGNPAQNIPSPCFLLAQVKNGKIVRVPPTPTDGAFYCGDTGYSTAPGFSPEVRPSP
jgi:branched-chain amino acid transport system substrate-binding protein